ncbi:hypothetical protein ACFSCX_23420 [Bacillus salitolerans]|uniref:Transposase n=1 Tax=Bacillus salitolerans TaxID=1437434 RepID=A0ABW4LZ70_9BACI
MNVQNQSKTRLKNAWIKKGTPLLEKLFRIVSNVDNFKSDYQLVKRWDLRFKRIATIMEPSENKTSSWVEHRLKQYLDQIKQELNREEDHAFVDNLLRYSNGFWKGLFTIYEFPLLPRTNNDLELFFRRTKVRHRRITGSRTWNRYIVRHGENIVFVECVTNEQDGLNKIKNANYSTYKNEASKWNNRILEHTKQRRFKKDPNAYLLNIESTWNKHN